MNLQALTLNPSYVAISAWWQHVPIAHWLVSELKPARIVELGSHYGVSFFSFCEAAEAFSPETFIYAVDTWEGDDHAGRYGDDVFAQVHCHWARHHRQRSMMIRTSFDAAAQYFEDNSVDLLHIDGMHTYDAVKHDYITWIPKLKKDSIVLLHDINVRERDFGVWRLWEELSHTHRTHEVPNGHGLGIIVHGETLAARLEALPQVLPTLVAKGVLLERIAELTPGGSLSETPRRSEMEQLRVEAKQARADADLSREEATCAKAEADHARTQFKQLTESTTWRLTAPIRKTKDFFRGGM